MTKGSESICDICGKNMPSAISIASANKKYDFTISSSGKIWDMCDACRCSFRKWAITRTEEEENKECGTPFIEVIADHCRHCKLRKECAGKMLRRKAHECKTKSKKV